MKRNVKSKLGEPASLWSHLAVAPPPLPAQTQQQLDANQSKESLRCPLLAFVPIGLGPSVSVEVAFFVNHDGQFVPGGLLLDLGHGADPRELAREMVERNGGEPDVVLRRGKDRKYRFKFGAATKGFAEVEIKDDLGGPLPHEVGVGIAEELVSFIRSGALSLVESGQTELLKSHLERMLQAFALKVNASPAPFQMGLYEMHAEAVKRAPLDYTLPVDNLQVWMKRALALVIVLPIIFFFLIVVSAVKYSKTSVAPVATLKRVRKLKYERTELAIYKKAFANLPQKYVDQLNLLADPEVGWASIAHCSDAKVASQWKRYQLLLNKYEPK